VEVILALPSSHSPLFPLTNPHTTHTHPTHVNTHTALLERSGRPLAVSCGGERAQQRILPFPWAAA